MCLAGYVSSQGPATSNYQGTVVFREGGGRKGLALAVKGQRPSCMVPGGHICGQGWSSLCVILGALHWQSRASTFRAVCIGSEAPAPLYRPRGLHQKSRASIPVFLKGGGGLHWQLKRQHPCWGTGEVVHWHTRTSTSVNVQGSAVALTASTLTTWS